MAASWLVAIGIGWLRRREPGGFPWLQVGSAMLAGFLAFNKVYSPQYFMWLLPFLVLLRVRWGWWLAYWVIDALLFLGINRWFWEMGHDPRFTLAKQAAVAGVWGKSIILALLVVVLARAPLAFERRTTKAADEQLTRAWAAEFGPRGVRVNTVAPGVTLTPGNESSRPVLDAMTANTPGGVVVRPEHIASGVVFLASDDAAMVHGTILDVDGGISATRMG